MAVYGADPSVAIAVQAPPLVGRSSKATEATPEPAPSSALAWRSTLGPPTDAPSAGAVRVAVGAVLSTRTVRVGLAPRWPLPSVASARRS